MAFQSGDGTNPDSCNSTLKVKPRSKWPTVSDDAGEMEKVVTFGNIKGDGSPVACTDKANTWTEVQTFSEMPVFSKGAGSALSVMTADQGKWRKMYAFESPYYLGTVMLTYNSSKGTDKSWGMGIIGVRLRRVGTAANSVSNDIAWLTYYGDSALSNTVALVEYGGGGKYSVEIWCKSTSINHDCIMSIMGQYGKVTGGTNVPNVNVLFTAVTSEIKVTADTSADGLKSAVKTKYNLGDDALLNVTLISST